MDFLKKIFGLNSSDKKKNENVSNEDFFETDYIKDLVEKYKKKTILLKPNKSKEELKWTESKFGGYPNLESFTEYPKCDACDSSLNFVFQLYKKDFPNFYFPDDANLFQLFRCPNDYCSDAYDDQYDHKMFHYFSTAKCEINNDFQKDKSDLPDLEAEVPDSYLKPTETFDFPSYGDYDKNELEAVEDNFGRAFYKEFRERHPAIANTKFGGYPSFTQSPHYPKCNCGKTKEFLFQLASEDPQEDVERLPNQYNWSAHGIMMGDVGNIYYFFCKDCGEKSVESYWDCH